MLPRVLQTSSKRALPGCAVIMAAASAHRMLCTCKALLAILAGVMPGVAMCLTVQHPNMTCTPVVQARFPS